MDRTKIEVTEEGIIIIDDLISDAVYFDYIRESCNYDIEFKNYKAYQRVYAYYKAYLEQIVNLKTRYVKLAKLRNEYWENASYPIWNDKVTKGELEAMSMILGLSRRNIIKLLKVKLK